MCGRFSLDRLPDNIVEALIDAEFMFTPREQIYPSDNVQVVFRAENGNELTQMKWGWERSFTKRPLINARANEAWEKPTWKEAIKYRRCIIPASAYYEWNENQAKGKRDRYRIEPVIGNGFALGGLYEVNKQTGEMFMSILTTEPNSKMAEIHHRMPVIIDVNESEVWLQSETQDEISNMFKPLESSQIALYRQ